MARIVNPDTVTVELDADDLDLIRHLLVVQEHYGLASYDAPAQRLADLLGLEI